MARSPNARTVMLSEAKHLYFWYNESLQLAALVSE
jgi:hypothetical protein